MVGVVAGLPSGARQWCRSWLIFRFATLGPVEPPWQSIGTFVACRALRSEPKPHFRSSREAPTSPTHQSGLAPLAMRLALAGRSACQFTCQVAVVRESCWMLA